MSIFLAKSIMAIEGLFRKRHERSFSRSDVLMPSSFSFLTSYVTVSAQMFFDSLISSNKDEDGKKLNSVNLNIIIKYSDESVTQIDNALILKKEEYQSLIKILRNEKSIQLFEKYGEEIKSIEEEIDTLKKEREELQGKLKELRKILEGDLLQNTEDDKTKYADIKNKIKLAKLDEAIDELEPILEKNEKYNQFCLLKFRFNEIKKQNMQGFISQIEFTLLRTQWVFSFLEFIDIIKASDEQCGNRQ